MIRSDSRTTQTREAAEHAFTQLEPRVGMVSFRVADIERSLEFYVDALGMTERMRIPGWGPDEHELVLEYKGMPGAVVMLMWNSKRTEPYRVGDAYNRLTILVNDVHKALKHLQDLGTKVLMPVTATNGVSFAVIADPDGFMIELLQLELR
jgi:lactoylglutathione lyase